MKRLRFLLILDTFLLVTLVILWVPQSSLPVHEWLGLAVIPVAVIHLLFGWQWIATAMPRLLAKGAWRLRVNFLINLLLFYAFVVAMFSGVMASVIALPWLGIPMASDQNWQQMHNKWANNYFPLLAGLHLAMNWNWIVGTVRRLVLKRPDARGDAAIAAVAAEEMQV
jgi:hypothetical protein